MREGPFVRTSPWTDDKGNVWMKGVSVKVTGERGTFWFVCHCLNKETGAEWLDIMGGGRNHQTMRSFKIDRVRLVRITRRRRTC